MDERFLSRDLARRQFLRFLAASPLLSSPVATRAMAENPSGRKSVIARAEDAINVFDLEEVARANLSTAHYGYLANGTYDNKTLEANLAAFDDYVLRARRLVNVSSVDTSVSLFDRRWRTPIALAPIGGHTAYHRDGERAVARAASTRGHVQMLSTMSATPVEAVNEAHGEPVWFQLYPTNEWAVTQALVERAERSGCPAVVVTVDRPAPRRMERFMRARRDDPTDCTGCHTTPRNERVGPLAERLALDPHFEGVDLSSLKALSASALDWSFVSRLKKLTKMRVVLKGIVTAEDAILARESGADGIIVSNHGGRSEDSGRSTLACLPEIASAIGGDIPILMDGGIRRGTDIFKAVALGADAVAIGRPYIWGLAAFGQSGVEAVLDILTAEFEIAMKAHGAIAVGDINANYLAKV